MAVTPQAWSYPEKSASCPEWNRGLGRTGVGVGGENLPGPQWGDPGSRTDTSGVTQHMSILRHEDVSWRREVTTQDRTCMMIQM